ncbi:MAG: hypothetical protein OEM79_02070 [Nitrosopumilus sp.]|nr:hypothetical protein [Nitrosopumilus sp.]
MTENNQYPKINFSANKIHVHHWPLTSSVWSESTKKMIDLELNDNPEKKNILIEEQKIRINNYEFNKIKKVGVTVPLFKTETRMVFEGQFKNINAHVHITTNSKNYLEIFNKLMVWKNKYFLDFP